MKKRYKYCISTRNEKGRWDNECGYVDTIPELQTELRVALETSTDAIVFRVIVRSGED